MRLIRRFDLVYKPCCSDSATYIPRVKTMQIVAGVNKLSL